MRDIRTVLIFMALSPALNTTRCNNPIKTNIGLPLTHTHKPHRFITALYLQVCLHNIHLVLSLYSILFRHYINMPRYSTAQ